MWASAGARSARCAILVLCFANSAALAAGWQVQSYVDKMTDRRETYVTLPAASGAATLQVSCYPAMAGFPAHLFPEIVFPQPIGIYEVGVSFRFDEGTVVPRIPRISTNGKSIWLWSGGEASAVRQIGRSKRLRVMVRSLFLDFDLTGAKDAIGHIKCK